MVVHSCNLGAREAQQDSWWCTLSLQGWGGTELLVVHTCKLGAREAQRDSWWCTFVTLGLGRLSRIYGGAHL